MAQSIVFFTGFETGDGSEVATLGANCTIQASVKNTGGYGLKIVSGGATTLVTGLADGQISARVYFQFSSSSPVGNNGFAFANGAAATLAAVYVGSDLLLHVTDDTAGDTVGTTLLSPNRWYRIDFAYDVSTGSSFYRVDLDGVIEFNFSITPGAGPLTVDRVILKGDSTGSFYFDDARVDKGGGTPLGAGRTIARQGIAGTPTYDAWTKHGGATAATCWSDTPFDTTNYCDDTSLNAYQTMLVGLFSADPLRAVEGLEYISSGINVAKVCLVGKSSLTAAGAGAFNIRRRVGGVDTDTAKTFTTADAYYETELFTDTLAHLDAYEAGAGHGAVAATHTVRDVWLMVEAQVLLSNAPTITGTFTEQSREMPNIRRAPTMVAY